VVEGDGVIWFRNVPRVVQSAVAAHGLGVRECYLEHEEPGSDLSCVATLLTAQGHPAALVVTSDEDTVLTVSLLIGPDPDLIDTSAMEREIAATIVHLLRHLANQPHLAEDWRTGER
jgi:uncharacterized protein YbjT (DUF2867 family)